MDAPQTGITPENAVEAGRDSKWKRLPSLFVPHGQGLGYRLYIGALLTRMERIHQASPQHSSEQLGLAVWSNKGISGER